MRSSIFFLLLAALGGCRGVIANDGNNAADDSSTDVGDAATPTTTLPPNGLGDLSLPCAVADVIATYCLACHGAPPVDTVSLMSVADFQKPSVSAPSLSEGALMVQRLQGTPSPMPPVGSPPPPVDAIAILDDWVAGGMPLRAADDVSCVSADAPSLPPPPADPLAAAAICTSGNTWTHGDEGSGLMDPGMACITCHTTTTGPKLTIGGTLYPTGHEPDLCNGGPTSASIVVTDANDKVYTLPPNTAGNFELSSAIAMPYTAKVVDGTRERAMLTPQTSGDCNSCHTQTGANGALGRITEPL